MSEILFRFSKWEHILKFDIQNPILTFELWQNTVVAAFWHSKSHFDIRISAEYRILTFEILFCFSNWDQMSKFEFQNPILTFELGPNMIFLHSKSYVNIGTTFEVLS